MKNFDKEPFQTIHLDDASLAKISFPPRIPVMTSLSFSTSGKHILVGTAGDGHYIIDAYEGTLLGKLDGFVGLERGKSGTTLGMVPTRGISGEEVCWTPDSKFVVGGSRAGKIHIWDIANASLSPAAPGQDPKKVSPAMTLDGHPGASRCVKFNPRYAMMCSAGQELVRLCRLDSRLALLTLSLGILAA